jgi:hypothetical protein
MRTSARCLSIVLLAVLILFSGCTNEELRGEKTTVPTPTPEPTVSTQDPIIGTWYWTMFDKSKTIFYTFTADGQYLTSDSLSASSERGTWEKEGQNRYNVTVEGRKMLLFEYQPATNSLTHSDSPDLRIYPFRPETPTPTPVPTKKPIIRLWNFEIYDWS